MFLVILIFALPNQLFASMAQAVDSTHSAVHSEEASSMSTEWTIYAKMFDVHQFTPWPGYWVGGKNRYKVGDFDGDGRDDLIHFADSFVNVWTGYENGSFNVVSFCPWSGYSVGDGSTYRTGDFDGDGDDDLIHFADSFANIWSSGENNKLFSVTTFYPGKKIGYGDKFKIGEIITDSDGVTREDLLFLPGDGKKTFYIWKSLGDGNFQQIPTMLNYPIYAQNIREVYYNNDKYLDLLRFYDDYDYGTEIFLFDKTRNAFRWYKTPWQFKSFGKTENRNKLLFANFEGDRTTDIAYFPCKAEEDYYYLYYYAYNDYRVSFLPMTQFNQSRVKAGDFNGDGQDDLIEFLDDKVAVIHSNELYGPLKRIYDIPWPGYFVGNGTNYLVGDFNGDGHDDLVHFVHSYVNIWISNGYSPF